MSVATETASGQPGDAVASKTDERREGQTEGAA